MLGSKYILLLVFLCFFSSCLDKQRLTTSPNNYALGSLFIGTPENKYIFDSNISSLVYESLRKYFRSHGFDLVSKQQSLFKLHTTITHFEPKNKYISPDLLLFNALIKLEIMCSLYDQNDMLLKNKTFYFTALTSKPKNPVMTDTFLLFEIEKLLQRSVYKVLHYFKPFLMRSDKKKR